MAWRNHFPAVLTSVLFCCTLQTQAQRTADSLLERINTSGMRTDSVIALLSQPLLHTYNEHDRAMLHDRIASAYRELGYLDSASVHAWHVLRLAPEDNLLRSRAFALLGSVAFETEAWSRSADFYAYAARLFMLLQDKPGQLEALTYQARIDLRLGFAEEARRKFEQARALSVELQDQRAEQQLVFEMAGLLRSLGRFSDAEDYLNRSATLCRKDTACLVRVRKEFGKLLEDKGAYREAWPHYQQVLNWTREKDPFPGFHDLLRVSVSLHLLDTAARYADSVETAAVQSGNVRYLRDGYQSRYLLAGLMRDSAQAYVYLQRFKLYDDSVRNQEWERKMQNVRHELFLGSSEASVRTAELQARLEETAASRARNQGDFVLIATGLGTVAAIFLGLWYFTWRRSREAMREQTAVTKDLVAKNTKVFGVMAHDLQGPVSTFANLTRSIPPLLRQASQEEVNGMIGNLHRSAQELQQTLQELLDWAVTQSGTMPFRPQLFSCWKLAEEVKEELRPWAEEHGVNATLLVPEGVTAFADRAMIKIVWRTLLFNAIRFSREGQTVTLFGGRKEALITMGVKDNGQGIAEDQLKALLSWDQPEVSTREKGVGLPMCKELVRRNGGDLFAESKEEEGSTFYFTLPEHPTAAGQF